ncbi:MAG TPA: MFS transporter, partial [Ktedonobacteraceae bacterium]|nr:MFS transporter [Ktedonobacteraceae bacterium]
LLVARLIVGFGIGIVETGFNVYITTLPRNAVLLNYMHACFGVGALVGPLLASSILALLWDWNIIYLLFGGLTLLLILGTVLIFHPALSSFSPDKGQAPDEAPPSVSDNVFIATLKLPIIWWGSLFLLVYVGIETCVGNWSYTFLLAERQQGTVLAGWVVSGYWLGLTIGRFVLQRQAERMGIEIGRLLSLCIFGLLGGLLLIWFIPLGAVAALGFCFIGFSLAPLYPATVVVIPRLVPARLGASAIGMLVSISILGIAILPWVAGILAQTWGIWTLLPFLIVLSIAMLALWVYLARQPGVSEKTPVIPSLPIDEVV